MPRPITWSPRSSPNAGCSPAGTAGVLARSGRRARTPAVPAGLVALALILNGACARAGTFEVTMQDSSMEPTFTARTVVRFRAAAEARHGEVIAFEYPFSYPVPPRRDLIARVVGLPGDEVRLRPGGVLVNGQPRPEPYAKNQERLDEATVRVPPGTYFVLGDDRANQRDSRWWGPLPAGKLLGVHVP